MLEDEYDRVADCEENHWWFRGLYELVEAYLRPASANEQRLRILDAGCGTGGMLGILRQYGEARGIDASEKAIAHCTRRGLAAKVEDLNEWVPPEAAYDVVTSLDVLYHEGIWDDREILKKFHRALKPGGLLILNLAAFHFLKRSHDRRVQTRRRYKRGPLVGFLKEIGFNPEVATYRLLPLFFAIAAQKFWETVFGSHDDRSSLEMPPAFLNAFLLAIHRSENRLIRTGVRIPFGSSVFIVARKRSGI